MSAGHRSIPASVRRFAGFIAPSSRHRSALLAGAFLLPLFLAALIVPGRLVLVLMVEILAVMAWIFYRERKLTKWVERLTVEAEIGSVVVSGQQEIQGRVFTRIRFDPRVPPGPLKTPGLVEVELEGRIIHFGARIIQFTTDAVKEGTRRALVVWEKIYSEKMLPENGLAIGGNYAEVVMAAGRWGLIIPLAKRRFLKVIWKLNRRRRWKERHLIREAYGVSVVVSVLPGQKYSFMADGKGNITPVLETAGS